MNLLDNPAVPLELRTAVADAALAYANAAAVNMLHCSLDNAAAAGQAHRRLDQALLMAVASLKPRRWAPAANPVAEPGGDLICQEG
ncbi:MAG: hypothetical protein HY856_13480 [Burkholderiales bacterium]|nr:hypothetical protein [Burkholderiales bacterium]